MRGVQSSSFVHLVTSHTDDTTSQRSGRNQTTLKGIVSSTNSHFNGARGKVIHGGFVKQVKQKTHKSLLMYNDEVTNAQHVAHQAR